MTATAYYHRQKSTSSTASVHSVHKVYLPDKQIAPGTRSMDFGMDVDISGKSYTTPTRHLQHIFHTFPPAHIYLPGPLPTPQSYEFQLLRVGITSSSSTRSILCSIRSRRWRRYYVRQHDQSTMSNSSIQSDPMRDPQCELSRYN